jgi:hypothetical protein
MIDYTKQSYYKYLSPKTQKILAGISTDTSTAQKQEQFKATYEEPYSFGSKFKSDVGSFMSSLPRIGLSLWDTMKKDFEKTGNYDTSKPFWKQGEGYNVFTNQESRDKYLKNAKLASMNLIPGYKWLDTIAHAPYVEDTKFGKAIPKTPISNMANTMILDSMIRNTGKWIYNPKAQTRRWFTPASDPNSRAQDYKERPFTTGLEDIVNVSIAGAPIFKALGVGSKIAATPAAQYLKASKAGQGISKATAVVDKAKSYIPNKIVETVGKGMAKFKLQQEFKTLITDFNRNHHLGTEQILQPGYKRLIKQGADLPVDLQSHLFKILEGTELYNERLISKSFIAGKAAKTINIPKYSEFKANFDTALDFIGKQSVKETNYLVKRGILTAEQADKVAWGPAVKQYLVKSGRYTLEEIDNILTKEKGFGKTLADEFDFATAEFDKYVNQLEGLGYKKPVYMPHQFEKYTTNSEFFKQQPIYKKTPAFLKTRTGVSGYIEEPFTVWRKHELQNLKWNMTEKLVNKVVDKFGLPLAAGEKLATGYKQYYPEGFVKNMLTKNPKLKASRMVQIPEFMASELNKMFSEAGQFEKFLRATYDPATSMWKVSVLALSPRWLFNNFMGNIALNTVGAVTSPMAYINSFKKLKEAGKLMKEEGITRTRAMAKLGVRRGVTSTGIYTGTAKAAGSGAAGAVKLSETAPIQSLFGKALNYTGVPQIAKGMFKINSAIEDFFRTAHYLDKVGKGLSPKTALASVNEFLFDYAALSATEKAVIRRIVPFWAWQKNITRLVVSLPFKYPQRMAMLSKLQKITEDAQPDEDSQFTPEWFKPYMKTPLKDKNGDNLFLSTRGLNPFADVGMLSGGLSSILSSLNPMIKIPLERATGQSLYKEKAFTSPYKAYGSDEKVLPSWWRHILSNFPQYTMIENIAKPYAKYDTGEPMLDSDGQPKYEKSVLLTVLKMFGINLSPYNIEEMTQQQVQELMSKQTGKQKYLDKLEKYKGGN